MGKRFSELFKTKQLANRIIIYETLRLHKAPSRVLTNSVALLASAIDSLERIDCDLLKKYMEDFLVTECEFQYGTPSCIFNCLNYFSCMQKRQFCKKCTKSNAPTIEDCIECFLHQADENTWGIMRDAHLHCENYELDEENLNNYLTMFAERVKVLHKKYGIDKEKVWEKVNKIVNQLLTQLGEMKDGIDA